MIPFIDLQAQRARIADKIDAAVSRVVRSGAYIFGPEVKHLDGQLAAFAETKHCIGNANGTDALVLPLWAWGVGEGDAVFCPSFTFAATAEIAPWLQATLRVARDALSKDGGAAYRYLFTANMLAGLRDALP